MFTLELGLACTHGGSRRSVCHVLLCWVPVNVREQVLEWLILVTNTLDKFSNNKVQINVYKFNSTIFNV